MSNLGRGLRDRERDAVIERDQNLREREEAVQKQVLRLKEVQEILAIKRITEEEKLLERELHAGKIEKENAEKSANLSLKEKELAAKERELAAKESELSTKGSELVAREAEFRRIEANMHVEFARLSGWDNELKMKEMNMKIKEQQLLDANAKLAFREDAVQKGKQALESMRRGSCAGDFRCCDRNELVHWISSALEKLSLEKLNQKKREYDVGLEGISTIEMAKKQEKITSFLE